MLVSLTFALTILLAFGIGCTRSPGKNSNVSVASIDIENQILGTFERRDVMKNTTRIFFKNDHRVWFLVNGEKKSEAKWQIVGDEIHTLGTNGNQMIYEFDSKTNLVWVAGKTPKKNRMNFPLKLRPEMTYKKIVILPVEIRIVGSYQNDNHLWVFKANGDATYSISPNVAYNGKWDAQNDEIHVSFEKLKRRIFTIDWDGNITLIGFISNGDRYQFSKHISETGGFFKKLK
jgi:hypothetical protein